MIGAVKPLYNVVKYETFHIYVRTKAEHRLDTGLTKDDSW